MKRQYKESEWLEEAVTRLAEIKMEENGVERFINSTFGGKSDIATLFNEINSFLKDGNETESERDNVRRERSSGKRESNTSSQRSSIESKLRGSSEVKGKSEKIRSFKRVEDEPLDARDMVHRAEQISEREEARKQQREDAVRAIDAKISVLRKAMRQQREYDRSTVDTVVELTKDLMDAGYLSEVSANNLKRLLKLSEEDKAKIKKLIIITKIWTRNKC